MKVGDKVIIRDHSYVLSVANGKLTHDRPNNRDDSERSYTVVEVGCSFPPTNKSLQKHEHRNDTVLQADCGRVVFVHSGFLDLVNPPRPPHVWKHGDVFSSHAMNRFVYVVDPNTREPHIISLEEGCYGSIWFQMQEPTFLFNIKDKL